MLAGFTNAVVARAVPSGALREIFASRGRRRAVGSLPRAAGSDSRASERRSPQAARDDARRLRDRALHGVTASGKTFVYIEAIEHVLQMGGRAIVLFREISLTPQTANDSGRRSAAGSRSFIRRCPSASGSKRGKRAREERSTCSSAPAAPCLRRCARSH